MSEAQEPEAVPRMPVPAPGEGCGVVLLVLFLAGTVALAVYNLSDYPDLPFLGLVASVLWLALVSFTFVTGVWVAGGLWMSAVHALGEFSPAHFVEARRAGDQTVIGFGYELFGRRFYYLRLDPARVESVVMNTGQATALAGRDMNDWSVVVWYWKSDVPPPEPDPNLNDREVYIPGPAHARATTEEFFRPFVAFLRAAGVPLEPTEKETAFRVARPSGAVT
jgi:hypothetical protein